MKRSLRRLGAVTLMGFAVASVQPRQSQAIVGVATGNPGLAIAGLVIGGAGAGMVLLSGERNINLMGAILAAIGLVFLDGKGGSVDSEFRPLTPAQAGELGISKPEVDAYNDELIEVNAVYRSVLDDTARFNQAETTEDELSRYAESRWSEYQNKLSPTTYDVVTKIRESVSAKMKVAASTDA